MDTRCGNVSVELSRKEKLSGLSFHTGLHNVHFFKDAAFFLTVDEVFVAHADVRAGADVAVQARANLRLTERKSKLVCIGCIIAHLQIEPSFVNGRVDAEQRITGRLGKVFFVMACRSRMVRGA